jgi:hypothetical protein
VVWTETGGVICNWAPRDVFCNERHICNVSVLVTACPVVVPVLNVHVVFFRTQYL